MKKKRGRPKKIINSAENIKSDVILLHLPINVKEILKKKNIFNNFENNFQSSSNIEAYNDNENFDNFSSISEFKESKKNIQNDIKTYTVLKENKTVHREVCDIMINHKKYKNKWPSSSDACCMWCCHKFSNVPIFIPQKYDNGIFHVFGNFCSFNCALSYNYNSDDYKYSEKSTLIHLLQQKFNGSFKQIKYAPDRETLAIFGGKLTIEEFRKNFSEINRNYSVVYPPFKSIIPQLEDSKAVITKSGFNSTCNYDNNDLVLKRNKPLSKHKNSLTSFLMN